MYVYLLLSSEDSASPDDLVVEGPDDKEKLGILQVLDKLEKITDEMPSK